MGMTERVINGKFSVFGECMVCGLWTWFIEERVAHDGMLCGICDERGLHPKDVAPPPPDVIPAAVCAWDEEFEEKLKRDKEHNEYLLWSKMEGR